MTSYVPTSYAQEAMTRITILVTRLESRLRNDVVMTPRVFSEWLDFSGDSKGWSAWTMPPRFWLAPVCHQLCG